KVILKFLKRTVLTIGLLLTLIVLAGLVFRLLSPRPNQPLGELVDVGGFKLHINSTGEKNNHPTLVIEGGSGTATEYYHWLSEGLKDSMRVVRYDRAGIGYSEASNTPRDAATIARELHALLENAGESPPYIMAGHSLGGPYIRTFTELYPDEVVGMVLLDTTHPERAKKITSIPKPTSFTFKFMIWLHDLQGVLCDLGIMLLYDQLMGPMQVRLGEGLPEEINNRTIDFLKGGKYIRTIGKELAEYHKVLDRAGEVTDFGALPIRIFPSETREIPDEVYEQYLKRGINLRENQKISWELQKDYLNLSTNTKLIEIAGNHNTIYTKKENADIICSEIMLLIKALEE
ncbi:MAG: alpha/beta hydrolase, partial [Bacteroidota bacterium]